MKPSRAHQYDVTIIGAGPAGSVAAIAIARQGGRVLLAEANPKAASRLAGEWLHPPGVAVLGRLGLLPIEAAAGHEAGRGFVVFPDDGEDPIRLPYPDGPGGLSFEHRAFVDGLRARAEAMPEIDYAPGARVVRLGADRVELTDRNGFHRTVSTGFIIGAEGRTSVSRTHLGLEDNSTTLSHMAGVELRDVELPFEGYGHVLLGGPGPILLYRISPDSARACIDIPLARCPRRRDAALLWRMFRPVFPESLVPAFRDALLGGRISWTTTRFRPRAHWGRGRVALAGDAVGYFHPLTAAGMTLGLLDAEVLATCRSIDDYRRHRARASYVAELLSNSLYHVLSREEASIESIRTAVYRMWGDGEQERTRTMRILITDDPRSATFAAAFLRVAVGALKHLVWSNPRADWWRQFPSVAGVLAGPGALLQWPAALLIPHVVRSLYQASSTPARPIPHLGLVPGLVPAEPARQAESTPRPSEIEAHVGLASAFGAIADSLEMLPGNGDGPGWDPGWSRPVEVLTRTRRHLADGLEIDTALDGYRRRLAEEEQTEAASDDPGALADVILAILAGPSAAEGHAGRVAAAANAMLDHQLPGGGFPGREGVRPRRRLRRMRRPTARADLQATARCCRALAALRKRHPEMLGDRVSRALQRSDLRVRDAQQSAGFWHDAEGRASIAETAAGIEILLAAGARPTSRALRHAGRWLRARQSADGTWSGKDDRRYAITGRIVAALIAARSAEVDAIERGVNALLEPTAWSIESASSTADLCHIAEGLGAFLDWSRDLSGIGPSPRWSPELAEPSALPNSAEA